jgi:signal transduction histidine kinase
MLLEEIGRGFGRTVGLDGETDEGQPIQQVISQPELVDLLRSSSDEKQSKEVILPNGQIYLATATQVIWEGQRVGRVCVLRDVTHFKELDALKSDFVSTVSHDLRSPLTTVRGYVELLGRVGPLTAQQIEFVNRIERSMKTIADLIGDLLVLVGIVGAMVAMSPRLALLSFSVLPLMVLATNLFARRAQVAYRQTRARVAAVVGDLADSVALYDLALSEIYRVDPLDLQKINTFAKNQIEITNFKGGSNLIFNYFLT